MGKKRLDPEVKRAAIIRIKAGSTTYREEAARLGVTPATLHESKKKMDTREAAAAPPLPPGPGESPLDKALGAAGIGKKVDVTAPPTADELKLAAPAALALDADYCVSTIGQLKTSGTCAAAVMMRIPILDERVFKAGKLGKTAEEAVRSSAPELAPLLRKYLPDGSALIGLAIVLLMDTAGTYADLRDLRAEYQRKRDEAEAKAPPPESAPVPEPPASEAPAEPWAGQIRNGPLG